MTDRRGLLLHCGGLALAALAIWSLFQQAGIDRVLTALFFDASRGGFWLKDSWWLSEVGHVGFKNTVLVFWGLLLVASFVPVNGTVRWRGAVRDVVVGMALAVVLVAVLKHWSPHSCPWDLVSYGGGADWFPLFGAIPAQPGPGRCLPAGHSVAGFSLFALYFALRSQWPRAARHALAVAIVLGVAASAVQVARGAHFVSHALWTAWIAWAINVAYAAFSGSRRAAAQVVEIGH
ncbi:MAG: hypothetical protein HY017_32025 [Betaproteobacteria bacterium]|nr:hypothetical protein [Betaproteobacteria bacterium]